MQGGGSVLAGSGLGWAGGGGGADGFFVQGGSV